MERLKIELKVFDLKIILPDDPGCTSPATVTTLATGSTL